LPAVLKNKVPARSAAPAAARAGGRQRKVLLLRGCVQPSMRPSIDRATARVLAAAGIETVYAGGTGCCGAVRTHLGDADGGLADMRRNIDAWMPKVQSEEVTAIVASATACSLAMKGYCHALAGDGRYAEPAARISGLARDLSELLPQLVPALQGRLRPAGFAGLAIHSPCTLQHGQNLKGGIETHLRALGFIVNGACEENHLCCGSAGTYSILQPGFAVQLRDRKIDNLAKLEPRYIVSANMGCIQHLQSGTRIPVLHWIELLDQALVPSMGE